MTNITVLNCNGLFESYTSTPNYLSENGKSIVFSANVKETKDPLFVVIDLSGVSANDAKLSIGNSKKIALEGDKINVIPVTTAGIKNDNGYIIFEISSEIVDFDASMKLNVQIISYTPVINH